MKTDPFIQIHTQHPLNFSTTKENVQIDDYDYPNYWYLHAEDCLVLPRRYGGQSLQMQEALSTGAMVLMPKVPPQNEFLPPEMMIEPQYTRKIQAHGAIVNCYDTDPQRLAIRMDELYNQNMGKFSDWANEYAETLSWDQLKPKYLELLGGL